MTNPNFQEVFNRLVSALGITNETALGEALGFTQSAWSKRKMRDSLPRAQIDSLIATQGLSHEYIYTGEGAVYQDASWLGDYKVRAAALRLAKAPLVAEIGHAEEVIDALINPNKKDKYKATAYAFITAMRDSFKLVEVDLNHLITGVDLRNDTDQPVQPSDLAWGKTSVYQYTVARDKTTDTGQWYWRVRLSDTAMNVALMDKQPGAVVFRAGGANQYSLNRGDKDLTR